ncbi:MAG: hypothetical protein ABFS46_23420, partial [Myxococcota bacterium]
MPARDEDALHLLQCLHGVLEDPSAYLRFLDELQRTISADCRVFHAAHAPEYGPGIVVGPAFGVCQTDLEPFLTEFRHPTAAEFPTGSVLPVPATSRFFESRFFGEILAPAGVRPGPGLAVVLER